MYHQFVSRKTSYYFVTLLGSNFSVQHKTFLKLQAFIEPLHRGNAARHGNFDPFKFHPCIVKMGCTYMDIDIFLFFH